MPAAQNYVDILRRSWQEAADAIRKSQLQQEVQANKKRQELSFSVGDLVLLSTTNLHLPSYTRKKF